MIKETKPDLVVLGVHRTRPVWDMFSGTTVERIVRATELPVLLVAGPVEGEYGKVLCGIDLSKSCAAAARWAAKLAPDAEFSTFHALHVPFKSWVAPSDSAAALAPFVAEARERVDAWWQQEVLPSQLPKPELQAEAIPTAFLEARTKIRPDLVAVGAHARAAFVPTLLGSFTEDLIRTSPSDVLILRG